MSDRLESLIRKHRKELDQLDVPEGLWDAIEQQLEAEEQRKVRTERRKRFRMLLRLAAAIVLVGVAGLVFVRHAAKNSFDMAGIDPELARQQVHYAHLIENKREKLVEIKQEEPELYREFNTELKKLDENYNTLKKSLNTSPNQEATLKAMVRNLKAQAEVLNQQLRIIKQLEQLKNDPQNNDQSI